MKKTFYSTAAPAAFPSAVIARILKSALLSVAVFAAAGCSGLLETDREKDMGAIELNFTGSIGKAGTKTSPDIPDTNSFLLKITDSKGAAIYDGTFGASPRTIPAESGTYTVEALSRRFSAPLFDAPQYGDCQIVEVKAGKTTHARLDCRMLNAGIILHIGSGFSSAYPGASLTLTSTEGTLMYGLSERRAAYFKPGAVTLDLNSGTSRKTLMTRILEAQQMLVLSISAGDGSTKSGISIAVDTTKNWVSEQLDLDSGRGDTPENAIDVTTARTSAGLTDAWVYGYIVGGDLTSSKCSFDIPFSSKTNLVLATRSSCTDRDECLSVQLTTQGGVRETLNLVDHPENLGRQVFLRGDIVASYYGLPGLQSITSFKFGE